MILTWTTCKWFILIFLVLYMESRIRQYNTLQLQIVVNNHLIHMFFYSFNYLIQRSNIIKSKGLESHNVGSLWSFIVIQFIFFKFKWFISFYLTLFMKWQEFRHFKYFIFSHLIQINWWQFAFQLIFVHKYLFLFATIPIMLNKKVPHSIQMICVIKIQIECSF